MALLTGSKASQSQAADAGIEFVHLHECEHEVAKEEVVPASAVCAHLFQPTGECGIGTTGKPNEHRHVHAFRQKPKHKLDLFGGAFQVIEGGIDATGEDFGTRLTFEALNTVVRTIPDEGMKGVVGYATIVARQIGACISPRINQLLASAPAFALAVRANVALGMQRV